MPIQVPSGDNIITGPLNVCLNGIDLGLTTGGTTFNQDNTYEDVRSDQSRSLLKRFKTQSDYTVTVTMADLSLDKLRFIYGQEDTLNATGTVLCIRDAGACSVPEEFPLTITGAGPACGCRTYHFPRAIVTPSQVSTAMSVEGFAQIEVEFTILPQADGTIGCIADVCDQIATDIDTLVAITCANTAFPDFVA